MIGLRKERDAQVCHARRATPSALTLLHCCTRLLCRVVGCSQSGRTDRACDGVARQVDVERKFFAYARSWWSGYLSLHASHAQRPVKLFALSEMGTQRPVSTFVQPLRAGRLLETPSHAAHFVSLISHVREHSAGASVADVWHTSHATLATRAGETEEHALLLCSLLLGFGLDAYGEQPHRPPPRHQPRRQQHPHELGVRFALRGRAQSASAPTAAVRTRG
jgi:hypothetical protein